MKKIIKRIAPEWLLKWYRVRDVSKFKNKSTGEVFTQIYNSNYWKSSESASGTGSELEQTKTLRSDIAQLINDKQIKSILDLPCGDFKWMQHVDLSDVKYTGADIVEELIVKNKQKYENENREFKVINLIEDPLPLNDMIMVRDCLVHLSEADILKALANIKSSGCKYLFTTTFPEQRENHNIVTGGWRKINLQLPPFNLPTPIVIINENCTEGVKGEYKDKSMGLWEVSKI
ncbi:class I SAM-dependent methyltransferase [Flavobacterium caeni]|uniref:Methyltransferase domain-containing protein n=1 Tax=Flavobacterium caeni TaxID=490189 RepID=A0A1G5E8E1_9FLAO|nr:class I SAM-dependent methyltransferase [Flavobacterium caeni]SCY23232.1 hypothetical protein SAMN02927903_00978 [Flavobacterium caeni]